MLNKNALEILCKEVPDNYVMIMESLQHLLLNIEKTETFLRSEMIKLLSSSDYEKIGRYAKITNDIEKWKLDIKNNLNVVGADTLTKNINDNIKYDESKIIPANDKINLEVEINTKKEKVQSNANEVLDDLEKVPLSIDFSFTKPYALSIKDKKINLARATWSDFLREICGYLQYHNNTFLDDMIKHDKFKRFFSKGENLVRDGYKINGVNGYVGTNYNANTLVNIAKKILSYYGISHRVCRVYIKRLK